MDFEVYFKIDDRLCGPFSANAANRAEMIEQASNLCDELNLHGCSVTIIDAGDRQCRTVLNRLWVFFGVLFGSVAVAAAVST